MGFLCIIEQSWSSKWLLQTGIKKLVVREFNHLANTSSCLNVAHPTIRDLDCGLYEGRRLWSTLEPCIFFFTFFIFLFINSVQFHFKQVCFISLRKRWCSLLWPSSWPKETWIKDKKWDEHCNIHACVRERWREGDSDKDRVTLDVWKRHRGRELHPVG